MQEWNAPNSADEPIENSSRKSRANGSIAMKYFPQKMTNLVLILD
jgi:hypothetical protein